ncbi:GNAT family N-acetyltransferase [Nocardioides sp. CER19]|uniref:GNAT family N-acetyltransferase n=1 Tax=Nocardioides sp. CER19 TaxID=3038538 RepID=UPI00244A8AD1|nr:GNAT family N-acetyltransferase [Nocardioides sp. CER19]MDH2416807.1 GNAT family N-acetyltransferase [Nocardioides sp. CER19]
MSSPTSDVSVRVAWAEDAPAIAALQLRSWQQRYAGLLTASELPSGPEAVEAATAAWRASLVKAADARQRVLVALAHADVVGFVMTGPATDPDCEPMRDGVVEELTVDPSRLREGHGSRLLQAAADTLVADRFTRAVCWVPSTDDDLRGFLTGAGWVPDGAHRTLESPSGKPLKEIRLHVALEG